MNTIKFNAFMESISIENYPETKLSWGFKNEDIASKELNLFAIYRGKILNEDVGIKLQISPYVMDGEPYEKVFILEVTGNDEAMYYQRKTASEKVESGILREYGLAYKHVADQFCKLNNLLVSAELTHSPVLQYIVSTK